MHNLDSNPSNVPAFLVKLWKLVEDAETNDLISWSDKGNSFIIRNQTIFARELLPQYFKHNNMASFIRQLNMYGFRKLINYDKGGLKNECDEMEFHQPFFMKGQEQLLELIKRKVPTTKGTETSSARTSPKDILTDLTTIRERQETMNNLLISTKKENELLWRELSTLRQKHKTQEQIIQKVIQFLLSIVQSKQNIGVKRKLHHMIQAGATPEPKKSRMSRQLDVVRGKGNNLLIAVPQEKSTSPVGPVIHEVTELDHDDPESSGKVVRSVDLNGRNTFDFSGSESGTPTANSPADSESLDALSLIKPLEPSYPALSPVSEDELVLGLPVDLPASNEVTLTSNVISIPENSKYASSFISPSNVIAVHDYTKMVSPVPEDIANVISIPEETNDVITDPLDSDAVANTITIPADSPVTIRIPDNASDLLNVPVVEHVVAVPEKPVKALDAKSTSNQSNAVDASNVISIPEDASSVISIQESASNVISIPEKASNVISIPESASNVISIPEDAADMTCFPEVATPGGSSIQLDFYDVSPPAVSSKDGKSVEDFSGKTMDSVESNENAGSVSVRESGKASKSLLNSSSSKAKRKVSTSQCNSPADMLVSRTDDHLDTYDKQLALSELNSSENSLSKNVFSNHVLNVEEELDWLQDQLASGSLNIDSSMLLGLFSTDEGANNTALANQLVLDDHSSLMKDPDNNITGNELVQFTPSMLEIDDLMNEPDFLGCLDSAQHISDKNDYGQKDSLFCEDTLLNIKQEKDFDYLCPVSGTCSKSSFGRSSPKMLKNSQGRGKRKAK